MLQYLYHNVNRGLMIIKLKPHIKSIHGRAGNMVFYFSRGRQYARSYCVPRNPSTALQQKNRQSFAQAVRLWQQLPAGEKIIYNRIAGSRPISGYNLFISCRMNGLTHRLMMRMYMLQELNRFGVETGLLHDPSVSPPLLSGEGTFPIMSRNLILKKPPGFRAMAA